MANEETYEGGCLCGAVRYRAEGAPSEVNHCHCEMCRRHGGVAFETWATFPADRIAFVKGAPKPYRSSEIAKRGFCATCGTPLTFRPLGHSRTLSVTIGSLDRPEAVTPEIHFWAPEKVSWLQIDDRLPRRDRE